MTRARKVLVVAAMALAVGLEIVGIENNEGEIFLGLMWKKPKDAN